MNFLIQGIHIPSQPDTEYRREREVFAKMKVVLRKRQSALRMWARIWAGVVRRQGSRQGFDEKATYLW